MAFQLKNFISIAASMVNWMKATQNKVTDFNIGSVGRTLVEAPAAEIDELYQQMFIGLKEAIPVSVYNSFSFDLITEIAATGYIRVTVDSSVTPILVPAATTFTGGTNGTSYVSLADVTIAPGDLFADVLVVCTLAGTVGNIQAGEAFTLEPAIAQITSASNQAQFASGIDSESEDDRKSRFNAYVSSLNRGTLSAIKYGLTLANLVDVSGNVTERVVSSSIIEPWLTDPEQPVSLVNCYVHNGVGSTSGDLVARAQEVIYGYYEANGVAVPGWKAAGVKLIVYPAAEVDVDVTGTLTAVDGFDKPTLVASAQQGIYAYILGRGIGEPVVKSELIALVMEIEGVFDITLTAPAANVTANSQTKLMPGAIAIS